MAFYAYQGLFWRGNGPYRAGKRRIGKLCAGHCTPDREAMRIPEQGEALYRSAIRAIYRSARPSIEGLYRGHIRVMYAQSIDARAIELTIEARICGRVQFPCGNSPAIEARSCRQNQSRYGNSLAIDTRKHA
jgi:hypothetical protein